jgi:beta-1,4-mannosyltransferase
MKVFMCPVSQQSLYVQLLLRSLGERYTPIFRQQAGLAEAVRRLEDGENVLLHVQWEEFFFDKIPTSEAADERLKQVSALLHRFHSLGGSILLTVHNELPHKSPYLDQFLAVRRLVAELASKILLHNGAAATLLQQQTGVSPNDPRLTLLPHPSYAGMYEAEDMTAAALKSPYNLPDGRFVLGFGTMRSQKGFDFMLDTLGRDFTREHNFTIRIAGQGAAGAIWKRQFASRDDVTWDLTYVPREDVPALFRSASCLMLPYTRVLTSGVAMLALTVGGIIVAPAVPTFVELLPGPLRRYLYDPDKPSDAQRAVSEVLQLTPEESLERRLQGAAHASKFHPSIISDRLGAIYDELSGRARLSAPPSGLTDSRAETQ